MLFYYVRSIFMNVNTFDDPLYLMVNKSENKQKFITNMFEVFKEKILKVKKPGNIQYLFFYLCSLKLENGASLANQYLKMLIEIIIKDKYN